MAPLIVTGNIAIDGIISAVVFVWMVTQGLNLLARFLTGKSG